MQAACRQGGSAAVQRTDIKFIITLSFFTDRGSWAVVQQGMNEETRYARRYPLASQGVRDLSANPIGPSGCDQRQGGLNLVALESEGTRKAITGICHEKRCSHGGGKRIMSFTFLKNTPCPWSSFWIGLKRLHPNLRTVSGELRNPSWNGGRGA